MMHGMNGCWTSAGDCVITKGEEYGALVSVPADSRHCLVYQGPPPASLTISVVATLQLIVDLLPVEQ